MKDIIKNVLFRHKDYQPNLASESCRDLIATEITVAVLSDGRLRYGGTVLSDGGESRNPNQLEFNFND